MKITIIGTGYVGLVTGVCISEFGFDVTCVDHDESKIADLRNNICPIYEPSVEQMLRTNSSAQRLQFTTDIASAASDADVIFIAVGTPSKEGGDEIDLSYLFGAVEDVCPHLKQGAVVIVKCTAIAGTASKVREKIAALRPDLDFSVVSNPEFLREGSAVDDFMKPDRVVIGAHDERGREVAEQIYRPLKLQSTPFRLTSLEDAELAKYASNAFLALKVTFINEIADLCEKTGANVMEVADIMGLDERIGDRFLRAGPGFGGSCFPKDSRALMAFAKEAGAPQRLVETAIDVNENRKLQMAKRILDALGKEPAGKTVSLLGVAFKPDTDDVREAPALSIIETLTDAGVNVRAFDPQAKRDGEPALQKVVWCGDPYEAAENSDAVVIATEWNVLRALDLDRLRTAVSEPLMIDLRNVHRRKEPAKYGFKYISIGRSVAEASFDASELDRPELRVVSG
ncbi:MAG: UDP-glucose/GDP-mannose dehydrogenase family protein [Rhizobiaceae bacterium]